MKTVVSLLLVVTAAVADAGLVTGATRPDLRGSVLSAANQPLENASIFIYTAGPRTGVGTYCPSCYADCRKSARSGKDGTFRIESLDPGLIFRVLVTAPGFEPKIVDKVDPTNGTIQATLKRQNLDRLGTRNKLTGRVLGPKGEPIEGAKVEFHWIEEGRRGCGGVCDEWGVQPLAVTDENGAFTLTAKHAFDRMSISVEARALARSKFLKLPSAETHTLRMTEGADIKGRVMREGKPVPNSIVGLVSVDRSDLFTGEYEIAADEEGGYFFANIPPGQAYYVYTRMKNAPTNGGVARTVKFNAGTDETITRVEDLVIASALRITGRVMLADDEPITAGSRMWLGREDAWDSLADIDVPSDGSFRLEGVPPELVTFGARVRGYRLSEDNPNIDRLNPFRLMGSVSTNMDGFIILLQPGESLRSSDFKDRTQPRDKPLRSAPAP